MSYLEEYDYYDPNSIGLTGGALNKPLGTVAASSATSAARSPRTASLPQHQSSQSSNGAALGGKVGDTNVISRYTDASESGEPDEYGGEDGNRGSHGGRYNKRLGMLGNHSLPVVSSLGGDPSADEPVPAVPSQPHSSASPSPTSEDLDFDFGALNITNTSSNQSSDSSRPSSKPAARVTSTASGSTGQSSTRGSLATAAGQSNPEDEGGVRAPMNTNRGSIWDPNLGNGLGRAAGARGSGQSGQYDDLRRRASATSALSAASDGAAGGRGAFDESLRRSSLQQGSSSTLGRDSFGGGPDNDAALAAAMLQKRGSNSSESNYEPATSRRSSARSLNSGADHGTTATPGLPANPAAGISGTPRLSDGTRLGSGSSSRQSAEVHGPGGSAGYGAAGFGDDTASLMSHQSAHAYPQGAYPGYPGQPPSTQQEYEYAYYMQQQAQAAAMHGHPAAAAYAAQAQQAGWYGHPQANQFTDPAAAAAYYQQQQAHAAYQAQSGMGGYPAGYYGHEYGGGPQAAYYAQSAYGGYAPSAYGGSGAPASSSSSVVGVGGAMASIPRRTAPTEKEKQAERDRPPITKQAIDEYRNRIKGDQDPEAHFNFAKYLIEAAKKFGAAASQGEDASSKALRKYRDSLLAESLKLIRRLATQGVALGKPAYADAQFFLANCLGNGSLGLQPDHEKAYNLYVQASKQNHPQATYRTAVCNERGAGTRRDHNRAVLFYRKASALGDTPGMYKLGMILLNGLLGQQRNVKEAVVWLKRAAAQADDENPHALFELGQLLENPPRDVPWVRQLITDCRDPDPAVVELAACNAARDFYTSAGQFGHDRSQHKLGQMYEYGRLGCPTDPRRSIAWYTRAAERGLEQSELSLSGWYLTGAEGVLRQSDNEAYLWARRAANKGLPEAELAVGVYYERGIGVDRDVEEAKRWFMRAAAQGNRKAMQRLTELRKQGASANRKVPARPTRQEAKEECIIM